MDDTTRSRLHDLTLQARRLLITEVRELLEGVYGLYSDGRFEPTDKLPAIQSLPEVRATRTRLETFFRDEAAAGLRGAEAVDKLVKETAFTHLNRLVAFKLLESRKLVRGTIDKYHDSNAFKFYLADPANADDLARYNAGEFPQNALGEGPRDVAYRRFLLAQCGHMAREIKVLFDPDTLASQLFPRPRALKALIDSLTKPTLQDAWVQGNEETIGWVYQSFNSEELEQAFRDARLAGKKFEAQDIPAVTQLFTPRWIVRFLVENTLGHRWLQMHPDSNLAEKWTYLVPRQGNEPPIETKQVRDITVLDPACGTMHFGLVAFDLLVDMYKEELSRAGDEGWPSEASITSEQEIGASIVEHNLFGIDIDLRAVQLSALTLYIKAKSLNPKATIRRSNLASADVLLLNGERLDAFLQAMRFTRPVYERVIRAMWKRLGDANQVGSLLKVEQEIQALVAKEQKAQAQDLPLFPDHERFGDAYAGSDDFWEVLDTQIVQAFDEFARQQAAQGVDESYFAGEATKGIRLLDLLLRRYDVVVTNPPYMSNRKMNTRLKSLVQESYPEGKRDLYAAFIQRCLELCSDNGHVGMLTMHSFMFISSYEELRSYINDRAAIETVVHAGPALFDVGNPGTLQTAAFVLRRELNDTIRKHTTGTYIRLVREPDLRAKRLRFEQAVTWLRDAQQDQNVYSYSQGDFDAIPGGPWVYWLTAGLRNVFASLPNVGEIAHPRVGLQTGENTRFLRLWWEVGPFNVGFNCNNASDAKASGKQWFPYMKGGGFSRWRGNLNSVVNWRGNGAEIKNFGIESGKTWSRAQNTEYYFRRGITYSFLTSSKFSARLSPGGFIFDVAGSSLFPHNIPLVLAVMNSTFANYALKLINPTVNFQVGDLARLPIPTISSSTIAELVEQAVRIVTTASEENETTYDFIAPPSWLSGVQDVAARHERLHEIEHEIDEEVYRLYGIQSEDRAAIEAELGEPVAVAEGDESEEVAVEEEATADDGAENVQALAQRWISYAIGIVLGRFQPGIEGALGRGQFTPEVAADLRELADADGIVVMDEGHPDALVPKLEHALGLIVGHDQVERLIATATGGKGLAEWLVRDWWKAHVQQYRKRPIYWLFQSPRRNYSLLAFHERLTRDSLFLIQGNRYLQGKVNGVRAEADDLQRAIQSQPQGRERKQAEKRRDEVLTLLVDLQEFGKLLQAITSQTNERGEVVGWQPEIDDGVLINLSPLATILPSWSAEPKKAWQALARGDYDWAHTAMRYWPERVRAKCRTNQSFAIAHQLTEEVGVS